MSRRAPPPLPRTALRPLHRHPRQLPRPHPLLIHPVPQQAVHRHHPQPHMLPLLQLAQLPTARRATASAGTRAGCYATMTGKQVGQNTPTRPVHAQAGHHCASGSEWLAAGFTIPPREVTVRLPDIL
eukprot:7731701-Pyramimonas_sp.AAC.1